MFNKGKPVVTTSHAEIPAKYTEGLTLDDIIQYQKVGDLVLSIRQLIGIISNTTHKWFKLFKANWYLTRISQKEIWVTKTGDIYFSVSLNQKTGVLQKEFQKVIVEFATSLQQDFNDQKQGEDISSIFSAIINIMSKIKYDWQLERFDFVIQTQIGSRINHGLSLIDRTGQHQEPLVTKPQQQILKTNSQNTQPATKQEQRSTNQQQIPSYQNQQNSLTQQQGQINQRQQSNIEQIKKVQHQQYNNPQQSTQSISYEESVIQSLQNSEYIIHSQQMQSTAQYPNLQQGRQDAPFHNQEQRPSNNILQSSNQEVNLDELAPSNMDNNSQVIQQSSQIQQQYYNNPQQSTQPISYDDQPINALERTEQISQSQQMQRTAEYPNLQQERQDGPFDDNDYAPPIGIIQESPNLRVNYEDMPPPSMSQQSSYEVQQLQLQQSYANFNQSNESQDGSIQKGQEHIQASQVSQNNQQPHNKQEYGQVFIEFKIKEIEEQQSENQQGQFRFEQYSVLGIINQWKEYIKSEQFDDVIENRNNQLQNLYERTNYESYIQNLIAYQ